MVPARTHSKKRSTSTTACPRGVVVQPASLAIGDGRIGASSQQQGGLRGRRTGTCGRRRRRRSPQRLPPAAPRTTTAAAAAAAEDDGRAAAARRGMPRVVVRRVQPQRRLRAGTDNGTGHATVTATAGGIALPCTSSRQAACSGSTRAGHHSHTTCCYRCCCSFHRCLHQAAPHLKPACAAVTQKQPRRQCR